MGSVNWFQWLYQEDTKRLRGYTEIGRFCSGVGRVAWLELAVPG